MQECPVDVENFVYAPCDKGKAITTNVADKCKYSKENLLARFSMV